MSQFPLEGGRPSSSSLRHQRPQDRSTLGITEDLNAPGLIPTTTVETKNQAMANQLARALGVAGQTVEQAGQIAAHEAARMNRQSAAIQEALDKKRAEIAAADKGQGSLAARSITPDLERQIVMGELAPPPDTSDEAFADQLISSHTDGLSQDYADAYASHAKPQIMQALSKRREQGIELAAKQNQDLILGSLPLAKSSSDLAELSALLRSNNNKLTDQQAKAQVVSKAISNAVDLAGQDTKAAESALKAAEVFGGDAFGPDIASARTKIQAAVIEKTRKDQAFVLDGFKTRLGLGEPPESVYPDAVKAAKEGKIDGGDLLSMRIKFDEERKAKEAEAKKLLDQTSTDAWKSQVSSVVGAYMDAGDQTGGAAQLPAKFEFKTPSGKIESVPRQELVEAKVNERFADIDSTSLSLDDNLSRKLDFLTKQSGKATYAPWAASLNGIATQALRADASSENVPDAAIQAVDLYERLSAKKAYGVINDHLTDDQSRNMLRLVDAVKTHLRGGADGIGITTQDAIAAVVKASGTRGLSRFAPVPLNEIGVRDAADEVMGNFSKAANKDQIEQILSEKAGMYRSLAGINEQSAVERAGKDLLEDMKIIDGQAVFVRGRNIPPDMEELGKAIKQSYVAAHGKANGLSESDISLFIDPVSGLVTVQTAGGVIPSNAPALTLSDAQRLSQFASRIRESDKRVKLIESAALDRTDDLELVGAGTRLYRLMFRPDRTTPEDRKAIDKTILDAIKIPEDASPELQAIMLRISQQREKK